MTDNTYPIVTEADAISALTSLAVCGDIAFLSCLVGEAKPSFRKRVESAMMLAMDVGVSQGWSCCTDHQFVWTGHEPVRRVLEVECSDFVKEHAREMIEKYYGKEGNRVYLPAIPNTLPFLEEERAKCIPNLRNHRNRLLLYLKAGQTESVQATIPRPASQPPSASGAQQKKQAC